MNTTMKFFLFFVLAVVGISTVNAKETHLTAQDNGVLGAMARNSCGPAWLSVVMKKSGILESELNTLRAGTLIVLPEDCAGKPPRQQAMVSSKVFQKEAEHQSLTNQLHKVAGEKADVLGELQTKISELQKAVEERNGAIDQMNRVYQESKASIRRYSFWVGLSIFLAVVLGAVVVFLVSRLLPLRRKEEATRQKLLSLENEMRTLRVPRAIDDAINVFSVEYRGESVSFKDTSLRTAGCPHCGEKQLKPSADNLRQHLDKHPRLRLKEDLEGVKRELGIAS